MTSEESQQLTSVGSAHFWNICSLIFCCVLTGGYLLAFAIGMHILLHKRNTCRAHKAMMFILPIGCGLVVLNIYTVTSQSLVLNKYGLMISLPGGLVAQIISAQSESATSTILKAISVDVMFIIANTIILWRAWAICAQSRTMNFFLMIMLLVDIGINIADVMVVAKVTLLDTIGSSITMEWVAPVINLTVNTMSTLLIVYRAWTHNRLISSVLRKRKTQVESILLLFIESGAVFAAIQVLYIVFEVLDLNTDLKSPIHTFSLFVADSYGICSTLNPLAIVILIHTRNTYEHSFHIEDVPTLPVQSCEF